MGILIKHCVPYGSFNLRDVFIESGRIQAVGENLPSAGHDVVDAGAGALLPGLQDHHIHLLSLAASMDSLHCGPPSIHNEVELAALLGKENLSGERSWLRGIAYHSNVAGDIDRHWLDRHVPSRPVRIQHRGGRLWVLNSAALEQLGMSKDSLPDSVPAGLEMRNGTPTGRLFDSDLWLRSQLRSRLPNLGPVSRLLASYGVTSVTDTTPHNGKDEWQHFRQARQAGALLQQVRVMGSNELVEFTDVDGLQRGELKIHLLESQLPEMDKLCEQMRSAHQSQRAVAVHCVTVTELIFALGCLDIIGSRDGDRIEHASVTPPDQLRHIQRLGLTVVTQPHFIAERGDQYLGEVDHDEQAWLYRLRGFLQAGIRLAAGSDSPFGSPDPWRAMAAAVNRRTRQGCEIGPNESIDPDQALQLFTSPAEAPGRPAGPIQCGDPANLCLLDVPWGKARETLSSEHVMMTWQAGNLIYAR